MEFVVDLRDGGSSIGCVGGGKPVGHELAEGIEFGLQLLDAGVTLDDLMPQFPLAELDGFCARVDVFEPYGDVCIGSSQMTMRVDMSSI